MSSDSRGNGFGSLLSSFVVGAATGATIALLTTPRSGREMRALLKDATREMGETLQQIPGAAQEAGARAVKVGQAAFAQAKEEATLASNKAADSRSGSKEHKGYTLGKELPRFAT